MRSASDKIKVLGVTIEKNLSGTTTK